MGGVDAADAPAAEVVAIAGSDRCGRSVGEVVDRHHAPERSVGHLRVRGGGEEEVHGAALVSFHVAEHDPAQPFEW